MYFNASISHFFPIFDYNLHLSTLQQVIPVNQAGAPLGEVPFTRTGLLGFVGPVRHMHTEMKSLLVKKKLVRFQSTVLS